MSKRNQWEDHYSRKAKKEKFPARSVYKLQEIQRRNNLIRKGDKVLDLGCFPGSWLLYAAEVTGKKGEVVGIDLKPVSVQVPAHVSVYTGDALSEEIQSVIGNNFNVVMSDMAPATTGIKHVDTARSFNLCEAALSIAQNVLRPGGSFVCKIFQGDGFKEFSDSVKAAFKKHKIFKPQSSRKASKEIYIIGIGKLRDET
ncbi:RlmE family RNA methyltransferase [Desulfonema magnum]|uniref:Ribosomal RNA large subunit methyltransferase E n=1 Tax=Desulfonema magnum TaxID=45655 RepID=A0A975BI43_9BACT|nr:RlmE family RNA methyltransferase [Desulfonema magnum]QTA85876.1 Ribosomal RNA large subunit methyltransferase E (23S rRNA methyltransferase) [Desulfonema magnum]